MAVDATANQPYSATQSTDPSVLVATPPLVALSNPTLDVELMTDLIFENIGGQELINITRNDLINGQDVLYTPIKQLQDLYLQYNPNNIIKLENTADTYFKNFPIKLETKLPYNSAGILESIAYIDPSTGDLIINVSNLDSDEQIDVQIINSGEVLDGTIY